jgi:protein gp37
MKLHNQRHNANCHVAAGAVMGRLPAPKARAADLPLPMPAQYDLPFSHIQLLPDRLSEPLHWWKPRTVAVCFMGDLFHEQVPDEFISWVFAVAAMAPQHRFLVLTKRAERMHQYLSLMATNPDAYVWAWAHEATNIFLDGAPAPSPLEEWPLPNVWLGVTAENQHMADERIPLLLKTPAAHRWASLEPLLGPVDLHAALWGICPVHDGPSLACNHGQCPATNRLDGVVVGGESGPGHRPMELDWAATIYDQCRAAHVPYYFKQRAASRPGQPARVGALDSAKALPWPGEHAEPPQEEGTA